MKISAVIFLLDAAGKAFAGVAAVLVFTGAAKEAVPGVSVAATGQAKARREKACFLINNVRRALFKTASTRAAKPDVDGKKRGVALRCFSASAARVIIKLILMNTIYQIDEPLVVPTNADGALLRLSQVGGVLGREPKIAGWLATVSAAEIFSARDALLRAVESGDASQVENALRTAQTILWKVYEAARDADCGEDAARVLALLNFPAAPDAGPQPVDVSTIIVTHAQPARQIVTTIAFAAAPGATHYWLIELRDFGDQTVTDETLDSPHPAFRRVRMGPGERRFLIRSRDASHAVESEEFTLTIPDRV